MQELLFSYIRDFWQGVSSAPPFMVVQTVVISFLLLLWVGSIFFALHDAARRQRGIVLSVLAFSLTVMLPYLGVLVYLLLRPQDMQYERDMQALEHQLAEAQLRGHGHCHECLTPVADHHRYCPTCSAYLTQRCPVCEHLVRAHFRFCPECQYSLPAAAARKPDRQVGLNAYPVFTDRIIQLSTDTIIEPESGKQFLSTYLDQLETKDFETVDVRGKQLFMKVFEARCTQLSQEALRFVVLSNSPTTFRQNRVVLASTHPTRHPLEIIDHSLRAA